MRLYAGTSGYSYKEWKGNFYPEKLAAKKMLQFYAQQLPAVEINYTFYRLPNASTLESWAGQVPESFRFALKASRRITHHKRLNEAAEETDYLMKTVDTLQERLGVVLFQLPPNFRKDLPRLQMFLDLLPAKARAAFEFRHPSWFEDDVFESLRACGCALCIADIDDAPDPDVVATASWGYLRLRRAQYDEHSLAAWADRVRGQSWEQAYVFFKHEQEGAGPRFATRFMKLAASGSSPA